MKLYIKASQRSVSSPRRRLESALGLAWDESNNLRSTEFGKCNFVLHPSRYDTETWISRIKKAGGKYVTKRYGSIYFYFDMSKFDSDYQTELQQAKDDYTAELNAIDIDQYKPDNATIKKIMDYRDKGSMVNVKAIKDPAKAIRYYYTACIIGWDELAGACYTALCGLGSRFGFGVRDKYEDLLHAIARRVESDTQYSDTRSDYEQKFKLPPTNGLFTFEDDHCWLPKPVLMFFVNNKIPVHFGKRTRRDGADYDRNGCDWTEVEHLTIFPDSDNPVECNIAVTTDEGGGSNCYTGYIKNGGYLCDYYSSAKKLIEGLEDWYARYTKQNMV